MKKTAAALLLMTVPALTGAAVLQDSATAGTATHTKKLILHEQSQHRVGQDDFAGTDKVLSAATHDVVGFDSHHRGTSTSRRRRAVIQAALSFKGGIIVVRAHLVGDSRKFKGRILARHRRLQRHQGTVIGRDEGSHNRTFLTMTLHAVSARHAVGPAAPQRVPLLRLDGHLVDVVGLVTGPLVDLLHRLGARGLGEAEDHPALRVGPCVLEVDLLVVLDGQVGVVGLQSGLPG